MNRMLGYTFYTLKNAVISTFQISRMSTTPCYFWFHLLDAWLIASEKLPWSSTLYAIQCRA